MLPEFIKNPNPEIYLSNNYLVLDCETSNKDKGDASNKDNILVYGFSSGPNYRSISFNNNNNLDSLYSNINKTDFIVVHGGKFELKWLKRLGYPIHKILIYDTLLGEYVLAGNRKWKLDLDSVSKRYGGTGKASVVSRLIKSGVCPSEIPRGLLEEYCQQDVRETEKVFRLQRELLRNNVQLGVQFLRCITTPVLADIEMNGIFLDKELVSKVHQECINRYNEIIREVDKITGGINMASAPQVARFLYSDLGFQELRDKHGNPIRNKPNKSFPNGQPLTDSDTILLLRSSTAEQRRFLELRTEESKLRKQLTGYIERFMYACGVPYSPVNPDKSPEIKFGKIVPGSCIIHGELNQSFAQTHRLTSSGPNLQNIDRTLKKVVTARTKKWKIRNSDYKQLEFRAAGILSQDKKIYQDVVSGEDIHAYTSQVLTSAKQPTNRQDAKEHTFKPLYGGNSGTKAEQAYYKAFRAKYKTTYDVQQGWVVKVLKEKLLRTPTGLIFYWPDTEITKSGYITNTPSIFNYPIQMFATGDIAPTGVCLLWHNMKALNLKSFLINEVHDNVLSEEHPEEHEIMGNLVPKCLSKDIIPFFKTVFNIDLNFPLEVDQRLETNWT